MSEQDKKQEAREHAARAARQMKHSVRNVETAAEAAAEHVKDEAAAGAVKAKTTVKDLAAKAISTEVGRGVLAISLGIVSISIGVKKLQNANRMNKTIIEQAVQAEG